ncbi:MAG: AraC family transcriptional regulator [Gemmatimonadetes bacterium]|nr:AraC family transcriptional regulator [Gemmatimonadota bacterium]
METPIADGPFFLMRPPYRGLDPVPRSSRLSPSIGLTGAALVWCMRAEETRDPDPVQQVRRRPGGVSLLVVLPPAAAVADKSRVLRMIEFCRPAAVMPYHEEPHLDDLTTLLGAPPDDLAARAIDFLRWRGIPLDLEIRRLVRRTLELSAELRSVNALARGIYLSRRALGRRFTSCGLPVPSHWLHAARLLRAVIRLQRMEYSLSSVSYELGYPDAFALSNQMKRLAGVRPSEIRGRLGWEWFLETWLQREAREGGFDDEIARRLLRSSPQAYPRAGVTVGTPVPAPESTTRPAPHRNPDTVRHY